MWEFLSSIKTPGEPGGEAAPAVSLIKKKDIKPKRRILHRQFNSLTEQDIFAAEWETLRKEILEKTKGRTVWLVPRRDTLEYQFIREDIERRSMNGDVVDNTI